MKGVLSKSNIIAFIVSIIVVQYLAFIDEGYYDFRWMKDGMNWFVTILYTSILFLLLWLVIAVVKDLHRRLKPKHG